MATQAAFDTLAAAPFLPRGKGAIILIIGGTLMVALSVFWSLLSARRHRAPAPAPREEKPATPQGVEVGPSNPGRPLPELRVRVTSMPVDGTATQHAIPTVHEPVALGASVPVPSAALPVPSAMPPATDVAVILERIEAHGVGRPRFLTSTPGSHMLLFSPCQSLHGRLDALPGGCRNEHAAIEAALAGSGLSGRVIEVSCNPHGDQTCTFEVSREGQP